MIQKVLVTYATKLGSTVEIAHAIGKAITTNRTSANVIPLKDVVNLSGYDAVIVGSAIRMGQWLPEAVNFVKQYQSKLNQVPTAIFSVHILNQGEDANSQKERLTYTAPIREILTPKAEAFFAGKIDPTQLGFFERLLFKAVKSPDGDFRDWDIIQNWAMDQV